MMNMLPQTSAAQLPDPSIMMIAPRSTNLSLEGVFAKLFADQPDPATPAASVTQNMFLVPTSDASDQVDPGAPAAPLTPMMAGSMPAKASDSPDVSLSAAAVPENIAADPASEVALRSIVAIVQGKTKPAGGASTPVRTLEPTAIDKQGTDANRPAKFDTHRDINAMAGALTDAIAHFAMPAADAQAVKTSVVANPDGAEGEGETLPVTVETASASAATRPLMIETAPTASAPLIVETSSSATLPVMVETASATTVPTTNVALNAAPLPAEAGTVKQLQHPVRRDTTAIAPLVAPKSSDSAAARPEMVAPKSAGPLAMQSEMIASTAEFSVAKPSAEPTMTVSFGQPAAVMAVSASAAQPVAMNERVLDLESDGAWIDQLAADIAATKSKSNEISFRLMPRHLGRLDVAMIANEGGISLKMESQHEATATIVNAAHPRLVDELRQQGVRITDTHISCASGEAGRQSQNQDRATPNEPVHMIETANERAEPRDEDHGPSRRGRFA